MTFAEQLRIYMHQVSCNGAALAAAAGIAPSTVSRYLQMTQRPTEQGIRKLAHGLSVLADVSDNALSEAEVHTALWESVYGLKIDAEAGMEHLKALLRTLHVHNNELAKALNYDPSYISRIIAGTRRPGNLREFMEDVAGFLAERLKESPQERKSLWPIGIRDDPDMDLMGQIREYLTGQQQVSSE